MSSDTEEKSVDLAEIKAGVTLKAGHLVVLVVAGLQGTKPRVLAAAQEEEEETGKAAAAGEKAAAEGEPGAAAGAPSGEESAQAAAEEAAAAAADPTKAPPEEGKGHLSVRLLDASGSVPLKGRKVSIALAGGSKVDVTTDARGHIARPNVEIQDYELTLGEAKVTVPAVPTAGDVHDQIVPGITFGFVRLALRDGSGEPLADAELVLEGGGKTVKGKTDADGNLSQPGPLPPGSFTVRVGKAEAKFELPVAPWLTAVVQLEAR
jgi:hypothetical protein